MAKSEKRGDLIGTLSRATHLIITILAIAVSVIFFLADLKNGVEDNKDDLHKLEARIKWIEEQIASK